MKRYIRPQSDPKKTGIIILVGGLLMAGLHFGGDFLQGFKAQENLPQIPHSEVQDFQSAQDILDHVKSDKPETDEVFLHIPQPEPRINAFDDPPPKKQSEPPQETKVKEPPPKQARKAPVAPTLPPRAGVTKVVIIIDDMGMDKKHTNQVIDMDAPLTLAFLPYASGLPEMTGRARTNGHELMIHMPMEAMDGKLNPGPIALRAGMNEDEVLEQLDKAFKSFDDYVGLNNHMGSRVTQSEPIMKVVMNALADRDLLFVDSKTIGSSVAGTMAAKRGLDYAERDVFLDHEDNIAFVRAALKKLEYLSRVKGSAIAIGHPKAATIKGLKEWLPTLESKGIVVVPVSAAVKHGAQQAREYTVETVVEPAGGEMPDTELEPTLGLNLSLPYGPVQEPFPPPE